MILSAAGRCLIGAALVFAWSAPVWSAPALHAPAGGMVRAVVVGIDKYPRLQPEAQLRGAAADARDISAALKAAGIPDGNVRTLIDGAATRARFIAEMDRLVAESKAGDLAIIAYSGHGMVVHAYKNWDDGAGKLDGQIVMSTYDPADPGNSHEVVVNRELRAWYGRLNAKNVDVLVVMDACFGGRMRDLFPGAPGMKIRQLAGAGIAARIPDTFESIPMTPREARADIDDMPDVTFIAGASETSQVPELARIDPANPTQVRGALSYYLARAIGGAIAQDGNPAGKIGRGQLFRFLVPRVRQATDGRQIIPNLGPKKDSDEVVFALDAQGPQTESAPAPQPAPVFDTQDDTVRVAVMNGAKESFGAIQRGRAPFVQSEPATADLVWDVGNGNALSSRGDLIKGNVNAFMIGDVIDRTWAVRRIQKLATSRIVDVRLGDNGVAYKVGQHPPLSASGVLDSYLTAVNIAADGRVQLLFPGLRAVAGDEDARMSSDLWRRWPELTVTPPVGTEYTVVIATSAPATDLLGWLRAHNDKQDAFEFAKMLAAMTSADHTTRIGTAGLFTMD